MEGDAVLQGVLGLCKNVVTSCSECEVYLVMELMVRLVYGAEVAVRIRVQGLTELDIESVVNLL